MTDMLDREVFASQELVFRYGDAGESAYVIESGCVEVLTGAASELRRIAVLTEGAMFGEVALLDGHPRTATVRTLVPTRLIRIDRKHVEELLQRSDTVIQYLMQLLLSRFRSTHGVPDKHPANPQTDAAREASAEDLHKSAVRTLTLAQDLSDAIAREQLELFYQPLIDFETMGLSGFEALVRWHHPALGLISPAEFIPLAEKTGLIHRIGQWVLQHAAQDWPQLRSMCVQTGTTAPFISINLSAPELAGANVVDTVAQTLHQHGMVPSELRIELTETTIIQNMQAVAASLEKLRELGVGIALDDFGTGYAGLDYLQSLPFSCLKIDQLFVANLGHSERSQHIIKAALELARSLRLSSIAEGIEDAETGQHLATLGCTHAQGYYFGKPMPKSQIEAWLRLHQARQRPE